MAGRAIIRTLALCAALVLAGLILLGFSGRFFPPGDSAAVIRPLAGMLLIPLAAVLWWMGVRRAAAVSLAVAVLAFGSVAPGFLRSQTACTGTCLTLYQKNLLSVAWPRYPLADDIISSGAQIVTLQEVSDHNRRFIAKLFDHYPVAVTCKFRPAQDVALLTSLPPVAGTEFCVPGVGLAGIRVTTPDAQLLWVLSVHQEWPFPFDQFRQSRIIARRIAELDGPVLIGGDFNMVPWGASVRRIAQAAGNHRVGPFRNTFNGGRWFLPLPLDNVLVPAGAKGTVELRPYMGSDHLGVLAHISLD